MRTARLLPLVIGVIFVSCTAQTESGRVDELHLSLAELVKEAAPVSHGSQMFSIGKSEGMTKEYGYPLYRDLYDARIVLADEEQDGFLNRLSEAVEAAIESDGLRITERSKGEDYRGYLYRGNGKRGTLDLFAILDADRGTRILVLVSEQPHS